MALLKETKGNSTTVTFSVGVDQTPNTPIMILGDFNDWQADKAYQMRKKNGSYVKSLKLENGKRYEFRYLSKNHDWFNDSEADDYVASPYMGIQNCVVDLSKVPVAVPVKKSKTKKSLKDDLKKIEGIGPKISSILSEKGIDSFEKLSKASVKTLEGILKDAGSRFTMHKPKSWPKQAKLAFQDKWEELKKLQDKLDGGK